MYRGEKAGLLPQSTLSCLLDLTVEWPKVDERYFIMGKVDERFIWPKKFSWRAVSPRHPQISQSTGWVHTLTKYMYVLKSFW